MSDHQLTLLTQDLGVRLVDRGSLAGSMSGSAVYAVTRDGGGSAVLKVTTSTEGAARQAAERELHVYRHLRENLGIRTPQLLDHRESNEAIAILLTSHPGSRPAARWERGQWLDLADDLATLHQTPIPAGPQWRRPSWLAASLHDRGVTAAQQFWSWPGETELLAPILGDTTALRQAISLAADCFLHGDCHTDNILIGDEGLVWTDWQGAGVGNPAAELAFPSVRATPSGATLPQDAMIDRYSASRGLDPGQIGRAVLAAELAIFLFTWPEYAVYNTAIGLERVHHRVQWLARTWHAS